MGSHVDRRIAIDKADHFLGTASVRFENLAFTKVKFDRSAVDAIKFSMQDGFAYLPGKSNHQISAAIDKDKLENALRDAGCNQEDLLRHTADHVRLEFPHDYQLQCFQGYHRVLAAKEIGAQRNLSREMSRWVIKLYSSGRQAGGPFSISELI